VSLGTYTRRGLYPNLVIEDVTTLHFLFSWYSLSLLWTLRWEFSGCLETRQCLVTCMILAFSYLFVYAMFFTFTTKAHRRCLLYFRSLRMSGILTEKPALQQPVSQWLIISSNKIKCYGIIIPFDAR
jgi:hypothetical protein